MGSDKIQLSQLFYTVYSQFLQLSPLQSPYAVTHFNPCLWQEHVLLPHVESLHLHQTKLSKFSDDWLQLLTKWLPPSHPPARYAHKLDSVLFLQLEGVSEDQLF